MIRVRHSDERGYADHGWLRSFHTFSFADYYDPAHRGFRSLRVMNEDYIAPGQGFGTHPHRDMEIVSYVLQGQLAHKDSMENGEILRPGEFQRMTAGSGITHSEFNPSETDSTHLYQIWLFPEHKGLKPSYEQRAFDASGRRNRFQLVASPDQAEGSLLIHQDARIYLAELTSGAELQHALLKNRHAWLQVLQGSVQLNRHPMTAGDGAAASEEQGLTVAADEHTSILLFDLA